MFDGGKLWWYWIDQNARGRGIRKGFDVFSLCVCWAQNMTNNRQGKSWKVLMFPEMGTFRCWSCVVCWHWACLTKHWWTSLQVDKTEVSLWMCVCAHWSSRSWIGKGKSWPKETETQKLNPCSNGINCITNVCVYVWWRRKLESVHLRVWRIKFVVEKQMKNDRFRSINNISGWFANTCVGLFKYEFPFFTKPHTRWWWLAFQKNFLCPQAQRKTSKILKLVPLFAVDVWSLNLCVFTRNPLINHHSPVLSLVCGIFALFFPKGAFFRSSSLVIRFTIYSQQQQQQKQQKRFENNELIMQILVRRQSRRWSPCHKQFLETVASLLLPFVFVHRLFWSAFDLHSTMTSQQNGGPSVDFFVFKQTSF